MKFSLLIRRVFFLFMKELVALVERSVSRSVCVCVFVGGESQTVKTRAFTKHQICMQQAHMTDKQNKINKTNNILNI